MIEPSYVNFSFQSETAKQKEEVRRLKLTLKEMGAEAKEKEQLHAQLVAEYEKMPKDLNRYYDRATPKFFFEHVASLFNRYLII